MVINAINVKFVMNDLFTPVHWKNTKQVMNNIKKSKTKVYKFYLFLFLKKKLFLLRFLEMWRAPLRPVRKELQKVNKYLYYILLKHNRNLYNTSYVSFSLLIPLNNPMLLKSTMFNMWDTPQFTIGSYQTHAVVASRNPVKTFNDVIITSNCYFHHQLDVICKHNKQKLKV